MVFQLYKQINMQKFNFRPKNQQISIFQNYIAIILPRDFRFGSSCETWAQNPKSDSLICTYKNVELVND